MLSRAKCRPQVMLCEFLRFLELKLPNRTTGRKPRIAVIVTAWDLLDKERSAAGPRAYLQKEYPLFAGRLADLDRFDVTIFAISILGGDPQSDEGFVTNYWIRVLIGRLCPIRS